MIDEKRAREYLTNLGWMAGSGIPLASAEYLLACFASEAVAAAVKAERERCAKIALNFKTREREGRISTLIAHDIRAAIRAETPDAHSLPVKDERWIAHEGGPNPMAHDPEAMVMLRLRSGYETLHSANASTFQWKHANRDAGKPHDIIAYRIVSAKPAEWKGPFGAFVTSNLMSHSPARTVQTTRIPSEWERLPFQTLHDLCVEATAKAKAEANPTPPVTPGEGNPLDQPMTFWDFRVWLNENGGRVMSESDIVAARQTIERLARARAEGKRS